MAGDRDLGVAFARAFPWPAGARARGWEMTSATGVRGLRLLRESGAFATFVFSEAHPEACRVLRENAAQYPGASVFEGDAREVPPGAPFDYVDLDPYGSPAPFVPTAIGAVRPGGVVAVTATDMMVLAGAQPSACERRYGARPVRGRLGPEGGLRILMAHLARVADSRGRSVRPLLAYSRNYYVRAYVEVGDTPSSEAPVGLIEPENWPGPRHGDRRPYGPLWLGPLFDRSLVSRLEVPEGASRAREVAKFVSRLKEEVTADRPFYFEANVLASQLALPFPPSLQAVREALRARGFVSARTHARPQGFRTDAPRKIVEEVVRWIADGSQSQKTRVRA